MSEPIRPPSKFAQDSLNALRVAVHDALDTKRRLGRYAVGWRNGKIEILDWREAPDDPGQPTQHNNPTHRP